MVWRVLWLVLAALLLLFMRGSDPLLSEVGQRVRAYTRNVEFDYVSWTLDAAWIKLRQAALQAEDYLDAEAQSELVREFAALVAEVQHLEGQLAALHTDPDQAAAQAQIDEVQAHLNELYARRAQMAPLAEGILQAQVARVVADFGLAGGGQPLPPVLFHSTALPWALIVSPRAVIEQQANISLETALTLEAHIAIEEEVRANLDVSTLVVPVGGVGTYPTMVAQSSGLNWLAEVVAHEWIHNYLTWHPLGFLYNHSPELRTMNETVANIAGKQIGARLIEGYYPELVPPPPPPANDGEQGSSDGRPPEAGAGVVFDFRAEMHTTRVHVDELLAAGQIEQAETYMEARRVFLWNNGYPIRKLNQAYFAFYGSYADVPVGPAGADPVGEAVRALWAQSVSLKEFIDLMAPLTSFEDLQALLADLE